MGMGIITIVLVDAILYLVIRLVHVQWAQKGHRVPLGYAVALFCLCSVAHFAATKTLGRGVHTNQQALIGLAACAGFGFIPIWAYVHMLFSRVREEAQTRHVERYPRAKRLRVQGDIEGALREYLKYYEQSPKNADPLFCAAGMLEQEKDFQKLATLFRQIMERFESQEDVWARAAYRLASIREHRLGDIEGAEALRDEIEARIPASERRQYATDIEVND
ncbi:MAG TPA: hypothetical protein PLO37_23270 [Candidatus Hydrogenedentes bacterium]|nr:hypothetical protein [Candidatus Hydrogenedentota bacterium]HPG69781.1 hypothetical protein [Candidatus Hydrogenedentota bacterium]